MMMMQDAQVPVCHVDDPHGAPGSRLQPGPAWPLQPFQK